jgi:hypothetical protein
MRDRHTRDRWFTSLALAIAIVATALLGVQPAAAADDTTDPRVLPITPPVPIPALVQLVAHYRQDAVVLANYTCSDETGGSGVASCTGTVPVGSPLDTSTLGYHAFEVQAVDNAGNETTFSFAYRVAAPAKVSITSATVVENDTGKQAVKLAVEASGDVPFSVRYRTEPGSADASDFTSRSGTLSFYKIVTNRGGTSLVWTPKKVVTVPLKPDVEVEGDESFDVVLELVGNPPPPVDLVDPVGTVTILDDDVTAGPRVSVSDVVAREGRTMHFVVALDRPATTLLTVPFSVTGVTATGGNAKFVSGDFVTKKPGTLRFNPGQRFKYVTLPGRYDTVTEPDETLHVSLGTPSLGSIYRATGTGTILDDD